MRMECFLCGFTVTYLYLHLLAVTLTLYPLIKSAPFGLSDLTYIYPYLYIPFYICLYLHLLACHMELYICLYLHLSACQMQLYICLYLHLLVCQLHSVLVLSYRLSG